MHVHTCMHTHKKSGKSDFLSGAATAASLKSGFSEIWNELAGS